jgi:hypothetical protein
VVVRAQKKNVLTVPIVALLAVGDGYGVEVRRRRAADRAGHGRYVRQGRAEVSAPGLVEGTQVGVAGQ